MIFYCFAAMKELIKENLSSYTTGGLLLLSEKLEYTATPFPSVLN